MAPPAARNTYLMKKHKLGLNVRYPDDEIRDIREHVKKTKKKKKANSLTVSDLPADLLGEILSWLHSPDRVRFGATCKKHYSFITTSLDQEGGGGEVSDKNHQSRRRRTIDRLPWLATFSPCDSEPTLRLHDPFHRRGRPPYATYEINNPNEEGFAHPFNRVITSKNGWLLFQWPEGPNLISFLLFSPFNRSFIKLPDLSCRRVNWVPGVDSKECMATFSSDPSCQDCVYFVLTQNFALGKMSINTLQNRRRNTRWEWKTSMFNVRIRSIDSVAYNDGRCYCLSGNVGVDLGAYDPVRESWTSVFYSPPLVDKDPKFSRKYYILECDGNLLLVCIDTEVFIRSRKKKNATSEITDRCSLFEFNRSRMSWVQKTSLGDHAIFIGYDYHTSFSVFKDGKSYCCKDSTSSCWSSDVHYGIWIQPPSL